MVKELAVQPKNIIITAKNDAQIFDSFLFLLKNRNDELFQSLTIRQGTGDQKVKVYKRLFMHVISENRKVD